MSLERLPHDMPVSPKASTLSVMSRLSAGAAFSVGAIAVAVLAGWTIDSPSLRTVLPGLASMKANTALAFLGAAGALWEMRHHPRSTRSRAPQTLACLVLAIAGATLLEYLVGAGLGIDELLFADPETPPEGFPGRMAPGTAVSFVLVGMGLLVLDRRPDLSQGLAIAVLLISTLAVMGYAFGVSSLYRVGSYTSMAIHTAVAFTLLAVGVLVARPSQGFMLIVASDSAGGIVSRGLLLLTPAVLFVLSQLRLVGEGYGLYDSRFGEALMVTMSMVVATTLVAFTARRLYHLDRRRKVAEDEIRALNEGLERKVAVRTQELEVSLAQVKQLRAMLPICAWCKKIRDDQDYWHAVESYISRHTNTRFSHGICPDCSERFRQEMGSDDTDPPDPA